MKDPIYQIPTITIDGSSSKRMQIAIYAMQSLLAKDFKNISFSAFNSKNSNASEFIADQSFILADAMIERENKKEVEDD